MTKRKDLCSGAATNRTALNLSRRHKCIKMKRPEEPQALNEPLNKSYLGMVREDIRGIKKKKRKREYHLIWISGCAHSSVLNQNTLDSDWV